MGPGVRWCLVLEEELRLFEGDVGRLCRKSPSGRKSRLLGETSPEKRRPGQDSGSDMLGR